MNVAAFRWGRRAAHEPEFVRGLIAGQGRAGRASRSRRRSTRSSPAASTFLTRLSEPPLCAPLPAPRRRRSAQAEAKAAPGSTAVTEAVARNLFKLMAVKDEYEVARLYTDGSFKRQLDAPVPGLSTGSSSTWRRRSSAARDRTASRASRASGRG